MTKAAEEAGVTIRCGADVNTLKIIKRRAMAAVLEGGEEIEARAFVSALDARRTLVDLVPWSELRPDFIRRIGQFRSQGASARVLVALDRAPKLDIARDAPDLACGPISIVRSMRALSTAYDTWRAGTLGDELPVTLRFFTHLRAAPLGKAVLTATVSGVPSALVDGAWTEGKRGQLVNRVLAAAETVSPGISDTVLAYAAYVPSDCAQALGITAGDLDGGEVAPDQVFDFRPVREWSNGRTPIAGLYLGGPSSSPSPFFTGLAGVRAARVAIGDLGGRA
jgi:phytoene dehydrogenase-like protein